MEERQVIELAKNAIINGLPVRKALGMARILCRKHNVDCDLGSLKNKIVDGAKIKRVRRKNEPSISEIKGIADSLD